MFVNITYYQTLFLDSPYSTQYNYDIIISMCKQDENLLMGYSTTVFLMLCLWNPVCILHLYFTLPVSVKLDWPHSALSSHVGLVAIVLDSAVLTLGFQIEGTWQLRLCSPPLGP